MSSPERYYMVVAAVSEETSHVDNALLVGHDMMMSTMSVTARGRGTRRQNQEVR